MDDLNDNFQSSLVELKNEFNFNKNDTFKEGLILKSDNTYLDEESSKNLENCSKDERNLNEESNNESLKKNINDKNLNHENLNNNSNDKTSNDKIINEISNEKNLNEIIDYKIENEKYINNQQLNESDIISTLGLNLNFQSNTQLIKNENELEKSSNLSIQTDFSDSASNFSLPNPPKQIFNEINIFTVENDLKNYVEQLRFFKIERKNLFSLATAIIENLLATISPFTKTLECHENFILYDFFSILEQIIKHGLKSRKVLIFKGKDFWNILEHYENSNFQLKEIIKNVKDFSDIKTNLGKIRAFLRLSFVHKQFNEIMSCILKDKDFLKNYYEEGAFLLSDELDELLKKTDVLKEYDFKWCAKDDKLDEMSNLINLYNYLNYKNLENSRKKLVCKVNFDEKQLKDLIEEKEFFECKSKEFREKIIFYFNRIKDLGIEKLFENNLIKSPSKLELLNLKLNELIKTEKNEKLPDILSLEEDVATLKKRLALECSNRLSKEAALESIEKDILIKQDENIVMRQQIEEFKKINDELCLKVKELENFNQELNNKFKVLTGKNQQLVSSITEFQRSLVATEAKYNKAQFTEKQLENKNDELNKVIETLNNKVLKEQKEKNDLQLKLNDYLEQKSAVITELHDANNKAADYPNLKKKYDNLKRRCAEYEQTMEEIGKKLQLAKLENEKLKEQSIPFDAVWKEDNSVDKCEACDTSFTLGVRRHHCRNCGNIFCKACSDNKIPLPANSKPMRVCDRCNIKLMDRYSAK